MRWSGKIAVSTNGLGISTSPGDDGGQRRGLLCIREPPLRAVLHLIREVVGVAATSELVIRRDTAALAAGHQVVAPSLTPDLRASLVDLDELAHVDAAAKCSSACREVGQVDGRAHLRAIARHRRTTKEVRRESCSLAQPAANVSALLSGSHV